MVFISEGQKWLSYYLFFNVPTNYFIASLKPGPLVAQILNISHFRSFSAGNPGAFALSEGVMACSMPAYLQTSSKWLFSVLLPPTWQLTLIWECQFALGHDCLLQKWVPLCLKNNTTAWPDVCLSSLIPGLGFKVLVYYSPNVKFNSRDSSNY